MCSKPSSFTPFRVFSLTSSAREAKDVSSNAPERSVKLDQRWRPQTRPSANVSLQSLLSGVRDGSPGERQPQESMSASADTREKMGILNGQHFEAKWLNFVLICILNKWYLARYYNFLPVRPEGSSGWSSSSPFSDSSSSPSFSAFSEFISLSSSVAGASSSSSSTCFVFFSAVMRILTCYQVR